MFFCSLCFEMVYVEVHAKQAVYFKLLLNIVKNDFFKFWNIVLPQCAGEAGNFTTNWYL